MNGLDVMMSNIFTTLPILESVPDGYVIIFSQQTLVQVGLHIITILALFFILGKVLFNPVRNILQKRRDEIADGYKTLEEDTNAVAELKTEYEGKLKNINQEADQILAHARKRAIEREDEIVKEAKDEADRLMKRAHLEIEREKEQMKDEIRREIIEVATVMASKFVAAQMTDDLKDQLVEETLTGMGDGTWLN